MPWKHAPLPWKKANSYWNCTLWQTSDTLVKLCLQGNIKIIKMDLSSFYSGTPLVILYGSQFKTQIIYLILALYAAPQFSHCLLTGRHLAL